MGETGAQIYDSLTSLYSGLQPMEVFYGNGIPVEIDAVKLVSGLKTLGDQFISNLPKGFVYNLADIVSSYPQNQAMMTIREKSGFYEITLKPDMSVALSSEEKFYEREELRLYILPKESRITAKTNAMRAGPEGMGGSIDVEVDGQLRALLKEPALFTEITNAILEVVLQSVEK